MPFSQVIAIDPAPAKRSTVFDGESYRRMLPRELRDYIREIASRGPDTLVCWDAPLTGPTCLSRPGANGYDFTKRPIERFFSIKGTGFKTPKGISVLGYGACPHWTITRSLLGLPRVGPFDVPESQLPFRLLSNASVDDPKRPSIVEYHPALAAWLWCQGERNTYADWKYKGSCSPHARKRIWMKMWDFILQQSDIGEDLPQPSTHDEFDAAVGCILCRQFLIDRPNEKQRCAILGNEHFGSFLVPCSPNLINAWTNWAGKQQLSRASVV